MGKAHVFGRTLKEIHLKGSFPRNILIKLPFSPPALNQLCASRSHGVGAGPAQELPAGKEARGPRASQYAEGPDHRGTCRLAQGPRHAQGMDQTMGRPQARVAAAIQVPARQALVNTSYLVLQLSVFAIFQHNVILMCPPDLEDDNHTDDNRAHSSDTESEPHVEEEEEDEEEPLEPPYMENDQEELGMVGYWGICLALLIFFAQILHENFHLKVSVPSQLKGLCVQAGDAGQTEEVAEENKSLIWSLLKQVRPGMDLSKVVLPTFILEPRSFLDKLTDYYYHADILTRAVQEEDPFDRMKMVVEWYLSGFYKKPKGLKKPYNPILGETFRCFWRHPDTGSRTFYIAEQVGSQAGYLTTLPSPPSMSQTARMDFASLGASLPSPNSMCSRRILNIKWTDYGQQEVWRRFNGVYSFVEMTEHVVCGLFHSGGKYIEECMETKAGLA
ncbi:OSBPL8 [Cordylochernes scorpioides]|uniref:OSBPL8 n=1 Tax=Cordylochernes scorpioides TaxID=51811 RepID=A0ABY6K2R3_9ARAC|nr:OSBPL8 [Cordylochernes scorpioides]